MRFCLWRCFSSIGDLVPWFVCLTKLPIRVFTTLQSDPRDLWPLRHLIRVMRRRDLTQKDLPTYIPTHLPTYLPTYLITHWATFDFLATGSRIFSCYRCGNVRSQLGHKTILQTSDIWDTDYNSDNWEPEFMTIFVTWQLIVTLDSIRNSCDVLCYRCPLMTNIDKQHEYKTNKYAHFLTDITGYKSTVNCFEVSSTGFISKRNKSTLTSLHKLMKQDIKKSTFLSNLNSLAWYGSYNI